MRAKTKQVIWTFFIIFLMTGGVFGFVLSGVPLGGRSGNEGSIKIKGQTFTPTDEGIVAEIYGKKYLFYYYPYEIEYIALNKSIIEQLKNTRMVYVTSHENNTKAAAIGGLAYDVSQALESRNSFVQVAFTSENRYNFPVITCKDASEFVPVVFVQAVNSTAVYEEDNCIIINATSEQDIERFKERLVYGVLGIIE